MTILRNTFAVLLGLAVALGIITFGISLDSNWINYDYHKFPYTHWQQVVHNAAKTQEIRDGFFLSLLFSGGVGAIFGGLVTASLVKRAKIAYAMLVGFILFVIALSDIIFTPAHPTWYELAITPVLFFFSWLGGLLTDLFSRKVFCKRKSKS